MPEDARGAAQAVAEGDVREAAGGKAEAREQLAAYCESRADTYRLFSRLIAREVNKDARDLVLATADGLDDQPEGEAGPEARVVAGLRQMAGAVRSWDRDVENDLACDYARVFLAAGTYEGQAAVPFESVYTSEEHLLMQDARDQVRALYRAAGLMPSQDGSVPDDFAGFELDYMAVMNERAAQALRGRRDENPAALAQAQQDFLGQHLLNWMGGLLSDVRQVTGQDFYRGLARALGGFLDCERADVPALREALDALGRA